MAGLYYPHDLNARNDPKCVRLRMTTGAAGYGVFNILLELLGSEPTHRLPTDYEAIAWAEHLDAELIRQVASIETLAPCFICRALPGRGSGLQSDKSTV